MAISPQFLDEIRTRVTLSEIVGRSVKLVTRGREKIGLCPFHNEKTPSFTVSDEKNFYHCFGCGAHGDVIGYVMKVDGLAFPEAAEILAKEAGLEMPVSTPADQKRQERRAHLIELMELASQHFENLLWAKEGRDALHYLRGRGLNDATIRDFRLGFSCHGNNLKSSLLSRGFSETVLLEAGLIRQSADTKNSYDFFRDRIIFPIADGRGRIIAFGGRTLGNSEPKYLNSPDTPIFDKGYTLYGIDRARKPAYVKRRVIVVEGYMDVITLAQAGISETVAPLGTALTENHLLQLWKLCDEPILCFDGDGAGLRAAARTAEKALPLLKPEKSLIFVRLAEDEDPDNLIARDGSQAMEEVIRNAIPLSAVVWSIETGDRKFNTPERLAGLEKRLEDRALSIADRKVQFQYKSFFRTKLRDLGDHIRATKSLGRSYRGIADDGGYTDNMRPEKPPTVGFSQRRRGPGILKKRLEQVLLAVVINHPVLLISFAEDIAIVNVSDPMLDKLRQEILKVHALVAELDAEKLKNQLIEEGNGKILKSVLGPEVYVHAGFAREDARDEEVRAGFLEVLTRQLEPTRRAELESARQRYVKEPTDENWARFENLKTDIPLGHGFRDWAGETTTSVD